jgi:methylated-DNA-[protein]-cysteine S-methyltransferase
LPIVVPCHRVIAAGGDIGGFMGRRAEGFERSIKRWLLEHEGAF